MPPPPVRSVTTARAERHARVAPTVSSGRGLVNRHKCATPAPRISFLLPRTSRGKAAPCASYSATRAWSPTQRGSHAAGALYRCANHASPRSRRTRRTSPVSCCQRRFGPSGVQLESGHTEPAPSEVRDRRDAEHSAALRSLKARPPDRWGSPPVHRALVKVPRTSRDRAAARNARRRGLLCGRCRYRARRTCASTARRCRNQSSR